MGLTSTEKLLLACIGTCTDKDKIEALLRQKINWQNLLKSAGMHQLTPLLYRSLKDRDIPKEVKKELKDCYIGNLVINLKREAEQIRIFKLLKENGIDFIPLKGLVLANRYYGDIALRGITDMDFLVKQEEVLRVRDILLSIGYKSGGNYGEEYYLKAHYHLFLSKRSEDDKQGYAIEVHWNIMLSELIVIDSQKLWENSVQIELDQQEIKVLTPGMDLFHAFLSLYYDPIPSLKYLADFVQIAQSIQGRNDWESFRDVVKLYKADAPVQLCLKFASECVESPELLRNISAGKIPFIQRLLIGFVPLEWVIRKKHQGIFYLIKLALLGRIRLVVSHLWYYFLPRKEKMQSLYKKPSGKVNIFDYLFHVRKMVKLSLK